MRRLLVGIGVAACLAGPVSATALHSAQLLSDVTTCDGTDQGLYWGNFSETRYITSLRVWLGVDRGTIADVRFSVWLSRSNADQEVILSDSWDHYAEPTGPHSVSWQASNGDWFELPPGAWITFRRFCSLLPGPPGAAPHYQEGLTIHYTLER